GSITVNNGGLLEIDGNPLMNSGQGSAATLNIASLYVQSGGTMSATGCGFNAQAGPGAGQILGAGVGAAYGGQGGNNNALPYGSVTNPISLGSGDGGDAYGVGGGALVVSATGAVAINGL